MCHFKRYIHFLNGQFLATFLLALTFFILRIYFKLIASSSASFQLSKGVTDPSSQKRLLREATILLLLLYFITCLSIRPLSYHIPFSFKTLLGF